MRPLAIVIVSLVTSGDRRDRTRARRRVNRVNASCSRLFDHCASIITRWNVREHLLMQCRDACISVLHSIRSVLFLLPAIYQLGKQTRWSPVCLSCINSSCRHFVTREWWCVSHQMRHVICMRHGVNRCAFPYLFFFHIIFFRGVENSDLSSRSRDLYFLDTAMKLKPMTHRKMYSKDDYINVILTLSEVLSLSFCRL